MFALGWHVGAARVTAQWSTEKAATAEKQTKALATALANQHAAEQKVAAIDQQFNDEVSKHANDVLAYRAQLAAGTDRLSVHVARCVPAAAEGASAAGGADGAAARADLAPAAADGVAAVAGDDQREIDKLDALQAYIRAMQAQGFIARAESGGK
ncbi:lysis protein [Paraburkholderia bengalensis]|uniref:Lysis protein n=2 Tax=Paraburkholderia bengalensis TaxID=2747562 RepID=A0ABU8J4F3_9BURK